MNLSYIWSSASTTASQVTRLKSIQGFPWLGWMLLWWMELGLRRRVWNTTKLSNQVGSSCYVVLHCLIFIISGNGPSVRRGRQVRVCGIWIVQMVNVLTSRASLWVIDWLTATANYKIKLVFLKKSIWYAGDIWKVKQITKAMKCRGLCDLLGKRNGESARRIQAKMKV